MNIYHLVCTLLPLFNVEYISPYTVCVYIAVDFNKLLGRFESRAESMVDSVEPDIFDQAAISPTRGFGLLGPIRLNRHANGQGNNLNAVCFKGRNRRKENDTHASFDWTRLARVWA